MKRILERRWDWKWFRRVATRLSHITPTCAEISRWSSESMDGRLSLRRRILRLIHFLICDWCRRYAGQLNFLRKAARASNSEPACDGQHHRLSSEARDRLKSRIASACREGTESGS